MKNLFFAFILIIPSLSFADEFQFKVGETCHYKVSMMGITAGNITTQILKEDKYEGKPVLILTNEIRTTGLAEKFYKLIQLTKSYWGKDNHKSYGQDYDITENKNHKEGLEKIDYEKNNYHYEKKDANKEDKPIESGDTIQDFSSISFFVRTIDWSVPDVVKKIKITDLGNVKTLELKRVSEEKISGKEAYKISLKYEDKKEDFFWLEKSGDRQLLKMQLKLNAGALSSKLDNCSY